MRDNFSSSNSGVKSSFDSTDKFIAQLRNVTIGGTSRPAPMIEEKVSSSLSSIAQSTDENCYSREFLKYRSQIQRELSREVAGVSNSETSFGAKTDFVSQVDSARWNPSMVEKNDRMKVEEKFSSQTRPCANPYVSNRELPSMLGIEETQEAKISEPVFMKTTGNPYTELVNARQKKIVQKSEKMEMSGVVRNGWLWNLRCFGVLGVITGICMATFSIFSATGTHQLTAMGFSLCASGVAMFTVLGALQAFGIEKRGA